MELSLSRPLLLFLTIWVEAKSAKGTVAKGAISVQIGNRSPAIYKDYVSPSKIYFFDIAAQNKLPEILINFIGSKCAINLSECKIAQANSKKMNQNDLVFTFQLLNNSQKIYDKYCKEKNDIDKFRYCEGIQNFRRSQSQFLAKFSRNQDIDQIRSAEEEESQIQRQLSEAIIQQKKEKINLKTFFLFIMIGLLIGYLYASFDSSEKLSVTRPSLMKKRGQPKQFKSNKYINNQQSKTDNVKSTRKRKQR